MTTPKKVSFKDALLELASTIKVALSSNAAAAVPATQPVAAAGSPAAPNPTPTDPVPVDYPLADGTVLHIPKLEIGGAVTISGQPAPDSEYVLADGTNITVVGGVITEIETADQAAGEPADQMGADELTTPSAMLAAIQKFADPVQTASPDINKIATILKAVFEYNFGWQIRQEQEKATVDAAIAAYKTGFAKVEKENGELKKALETMLKQVEKIADLPVDISLEEKKSEQPLTAFQKFQLKKQEQNK